MRTFALAVVLPGILGCAALLDPGVSGTSQAPALTPASTQLGCGEAEHAPRPDYGATGMPAVDELPAALVKAAPIYPVLAREGGVDGTVIVAALVCEHGHVVDTRVIRSIPMLDHAAVDAVKQWTYKPAVLSARNVPCWIEVPVRFSIH